MTLRRPCPICFSTIHGKEGKETAMQPGDRVERTSQAGGSSGLRLLQPKNPYVALGLAVSHLMGKPAFAKLRFGDWSRILVGQINRGHYYFAIDQNNHTKAFLGWALTTSEKAEAWVTGRAGLSYEDSREGDCLIINAWSASSPEANRLLLDAARSIGRGKQAVYFKRHYKDGSVRPTRIDTNVEQAPEKAERAS
jgi:hemolysin-activating ACP:hemolysin acyltransferase